MSKKIVTPRKVLATYAGWCIANGYRFSENELYGTKILTRGVHRPDSLHYRNYAGDINHGVNGAAERAKLLYALEVAESMGLACVFARDGVAGVAANHRTHLHVDCGEWSNTGKGDYQIKGGGDLTVWNIQSAIGATKDNLWGDQTDDYVNAVLASSNYRNVKFPLGVKRLQANIGARKTGEWDLQTRIKHDRAVAKLQRALGVHDDGIVGPITVRAAEAKRNTYRRK